MALTIGVDVGGTKVAGGVVDETGEILATVRKPTPAQDSQGAVDTIISVIKELQASYEVEAVGIGAPGFIDAARSSVIFAPNVSWRNEPLAMKVAKATGLQVVVENDANSAAWGEYKFGAAKNRRSAVTITVGTGIGGGIVVDGRLVRGSFGFAAEIGHMNMVPDGILCGCGENGCWEMYSSGNALVRLAQDRASKAPATAGRLLELAGGKASDISGLMVSQAAQEGDPAARDAFSEIGKWLGQGIADIAAMLDPEIFVLSGGVCEAGDVLLGPTRSAFELRLTARPFRSLAPVVIAQLGNQAGLIGAADLAREI